MTCKTTIAVVRNPLDRWCEVMFTNEFEVGHSFFTEDIKLTEKPRLLLGPSPSYTIKISIFHEP